MSILQKTKQVTDQRVNCYKRFLKMSMAGFVIGLIGCGFLFDIDQTIKLQGTVVSENHRKSVQSPEADVIKEVYVREGDTVKENDILLVLQSSQEEAELKKLQVTLADFYLKQDRLRSEIAQKKSLTFSEQSRNFDSVHLMEEGRPREQHIFQQRKTTWQAFQVAYVKQVAQLNTSISALQKQTISKEQQLNLIREEVAGQRQLYDKGLVAKSRYYATKRRQNELEEQLMLADGQIRKYQDQILQLKAQNRQKLSEREAELQLDLQKTAQNIRVAEQQIKILNDQIAQKIIRAPVDGVTFNMRALHPGYVTKAVETLMYIVPREETLVIDSRLPDREITKVDLNMETRIYPLASNRLFDQPIMGKVDRISNDALSLEEQAENQYLVRIIPNSRNNILPGMTVDMYLLRGEISLLTYVMRPLLERFDI